MNTIHIVLGVILVCMADLASASVITITQSSVYSWSQAKGGSVVYNSDTSTADGSPPSTVATSTSTSPSGTSTSTTNRLYDTAGTSGVLTFDYTHKRAATADSYAESNAGVFFTANGNYPYTLSGSYTSTPASYIYSQVYLAKLSPTYSVLFNSGAYYAQGVSSYQLVGAGLTGTLEQGRTYHLSINQKIVTYPNADSGATAIGKVTFTINPVPIPAAAWLFGTALAGLGFACKFRQRGMLAA